MKDEHWLDDGTAVDINLTQEEEYLEPPRMSLRDSNEVAIAILLLVVIGYFGYQWLTPDATPATPTARKCDKRPNQKLRFELTVSGASPLSVEPYF